MSSNTSGTAGASARREHERRTAKDRARLREQWGPLGGIAVALTPERQATSAWRHGAVGEERVGARLDQIGSASVRVLHDRRIPGTRANIDHIVITGGAVWVIDTKNYAGRPARFVEGGLFRPRVERLKVGGRLRDKLVDGVLSQVEHVQKVVPEVAVQSVLCFVDADWQLFGGDFTVNGVRVCWPPRLVELISASAGGSIDIATVAVEIAARFRPADGPSATH